MIENLGVRVGVPEDVHPMMGLAMQACDENGFVNPNPQKLLAEIWPALNLDNGLVGIIQDEGERLEGAILLRISTMWYSDESVLEERAIFIHPDYRSAKGGRARRLCEFSKKTAETLGLPLMIGVLSNHRTEAKVRLYERQFGKPSGAFFLYNAQTGAHRTAAE
jgi:hypothetical protein